MEAEDPEYYQYLVDLVDEEFNMNLVAPPYSTMPAPITSNGRLDREQVKLTLIRVVIEADMAEGGESNNLKKRMFDWISIPEEDRWYG